ncbi:hypothetical protein ABFS82_12G055500 [Erythranthe guttata]
MSCRTLFFFSDLLTSLHRGSLYFLSSSDLSVISSRLVVLFFFADFLPLLFPFSGPAIKANENCIVLEQPEKNSRTTAGEFVDHMILSLGTRSVDLSPTLFLFSRFHLSLQLPPQNQRRKMMVATTAKSRGGNSDLS